MADASLKYKRVTQMGNHIHNDQPNYRRVVELVQSGKLGRITRVHAGKRAEAQVAADGAPAAVRAPPCPRRPRRRWTTISGSGPAPNRPYHPLRSHGSFRHFWDYSGGTFIDFWATSSTSPRGRWISRPDARSHPSAGASSRMTKPKRRIPSKRCSIPQPAGQFQPSPDTAAGIRTPGRHRLPVPRD